MAKRETACFFSRFVPFHSLFLTASDAKSLINFRDVVAQTCFVAGSSTWRCRFSKCSGESARRCPKRVWVTAYSPNALLKKRLLSDRAKRRTANTLRSKLLWGRISWKQLRETSNEALWLPMWPALPSCNFWHSRGRASASAEANLHRQEATWRGTGCQWPLSCLFS